MLPRVLAAVVTFAAVLAPSIARAQAPQIQGKLEASHAIARAFAAPAAVDAEQAPMHIVYAPVRLMGSRLVPSLYMTALAMQALDIHSTLQAVNRGAVEANPLLSSAVRHQGRFIATKAVVAAAGMIAVRQLAKHNKVAAIATLVAINSGYAMVVSHNYRVASSLR